MHPACHLGLITHTHTPSSQVSRRRCVCSQSPPKHCFLLQGPFSPARPACAPHPQLSPRKHNSILRWQERQGQWGPSPQVQLWVEAGERMPAMTLRPDPTGSSRQSRLPPRVKFSQSVNQSTIASQCSCGVGFPLCHWAKHPQDNGKPIETQRDTLGVIKQWL